MIALPALAGLVKEGDPDAGLNQFDVPDDVGLVNSGVPLAIFSISAILDDVGFVKSGEPLAIFSISAVPEDVGLVRLGVPEAVSVLEGTLAVGITSFVTGVPPVVKRKVIFSPPLSSADLNAMPE